jgi:hypothetical protein
VHELGVLHVLFRGTVDHRCDRFGKMVVRRHAEFVERGEEVIVLGLGS